MLRHLSVEKQNPYRMLFLKSASPIPTKGATGCMVQRDQELVATKPWEKLFKRLPPDLKGAPPTLALIPQEIKLTCHYPEFGL